MGFVEAVKTCLRKVVTISGRARRAEFWWFYLFTILVAIVAAIIDGMVFGFTDDGGGPIGAITGIALFIPTITATIRRLHDTSRPGYYILAPLLFLIIGGVIMFIGGGATAMIILGAIVIIAGFLLQLYWLIQKSEPGTNKYGPNPIDHGDSVTEVFE